MILLVYSIRDLIMLLVVFFGMIMVNRYKLDCCIRFNILGIFIMGW